MLLQAMVKHIELWLVEKLIPYARNPRTHSDAQVAQIAASIAEFGFNNPILVDTKAGIIAGHGRLLAARKLGLTEVPVIVLDHLSEAQKRAYIIADNKLAENAGWEEDALRLELAALQEEDFNVGLIGFEDDELARLLATQDADPPYNVSYEGYTEEHLKMQGDRMTSEQFKHFLETSFRSCRTAAKPGASLYVCHSSSWQREFQNALEAAGFEVRCQIIWAKNTFAWGFGRYKFRHEPIFYCHIAGQKDPWYGDKSQSTLWEENKPAANRLHPTMKPVELIERALVNSSKAGDTVADLFGGSGSTLIACERRNRKARLMQLDSRYADVICERYQDYTGKQAVLEGDGRTFDEIAAARRQEAA